MLVEEIVGLTVIGLAYDAAGVVVIGFAFFSAKVSALFLNSQTFYGGNPDILVSGIKTRTDGIVGTVLLVLGFVLQILGTYNAQVPYMTSLALIVLVLFLVCYWAFLRKRLVAHQQKLAERFEQAWKAGAYKDDS